MKFLQPSAYHLPSLKFLQKKRLIVSTIHVSLYYLLFAAFTASILVTQLYHGSSYYSDQAFGIVYILFIFSGVGALLQLRRLTLAYSTKRRALQAGTTIPQYEISVSPIEASVLIDASDAGEMGLLAINSIQAKGGLRAWRSADGRIQLQHTEPDVQLAYYERAFMTELFELSSTVSLTDRQLRKHRAIKAMQKAVYQEMLQRGYLGKMSNWQQFFYEYGITTTVVFAYVSYPLVILLMAAQFIGPLFYGPLEMLPTFHTDQLILVLIWSAVLLVTPLIFLASGSYSQKGSETFRNVYGLYWFLKVAFGSRMVNKSHLSEHDRKRYLPYAKAFGLRVAE